MPILACSGKATCAQLALTTRRRRRLLRQAAAAAADALLDSTGLDVGTASSLLSTFLAELCQHKPGLAVRSPSRGLADLPSFLRRTGICSLVVSADSPAASAQAEQVLRRCDTITHLICSKMFCPHHWPPNLAVLSLTSTDWSAAHAIERQHLQLVCLQDVSCLQGLVIHARAACDWPAALVGRLPGSLRWVCVNLSISHDSQLGPSGTVDLSAFGRAAGCTADLDVFVVGMWASPVQESVLAGTLDGLCAMGSCDSLYFGCVVGHAAAVGLAEVSTGLSQLQCSRCVLAARFLPPHAHINQLPPLGHVTLEVKHWDDDSDVLTCEWAALAGPGVRCLGSIHQHMRSVDVRGCSGSPAHRQPWVLVIWAHPLNVRGLPVNSFAEEAPGMHVWRNAAGADLEDW